MLFVRMPRKSCSWCCLDRSLDWRHNGSPLGMFSRAFVNFPRRRRHRNWTISDVTGLRHPKPRTRTHSRCLRLLPLIGLVKRRPALNSSPSCCMRACLTGHGGKSRRSWPRFGSELRKVLVTLYFSLVLGSSSHPHVVCCIRATGTNCQDHLATASRLGCILLKQRVHESFPRGR